MKALSNSMWCKDKDGRLGMIDEINSGQVSFRYEGDKGLGPIVKVPFEELVLSTPPARLGYTTQQLADMGYVVATAEPPPIPEAE